MKTIRRHAVLGAAEAAMKTAELEHWSSPVRWLQSGCDGLVMLSRDPVAVQRILDDCKVLRVAEDDDAEPRRLMKERHCAAPVS